MSAFGRAKELYDSGGVPEIYRGFRDFVAVKSGRLRWSTYEDRRADNETRWAFMEDYLTGDLVLDVGCAEGYFTRHAASTGRLAFGIDIDEDRIAEANRRAENHPGCGFATYELIPENVDIVDGFDSCLLLTIHHWWVKKYGHNVATEMMSDVIAGCDLVVYEPPGDQSPDGRAIDPEDSISVYTEWLESEFGDMVEIMDCMMVDYKEERPDRAVIDNKRRDPIFILDCT